MQEATTHPTTPMPLWRDRDYVLLWCGQAISIIGTQVTQIAFPLLVLALTGSPTIAGLVAAARTVPYMLFTLPAGALVDRWDRKLTMVCCGLGSALALASVVVAYLLGALGIPQIVVVSFIEGTFAVFYGLAETSALPRVVPKAQLSTAVAQQQLQYSLGSIIGPPFGGALYAASPLLPFALDAASYAVSGAAVAALRRRLSGERTVAGRSLIGEVAEGVRWIWRQPLIRVLALLAGLSNFSGAGVTLLVVVLAQRQGASAAATGAIFATAGVGGVLGALVAPRIQRRFSFGRALGGVYWSFAVIMLLFAVAVSPPLIAAVLFGISLVRPSFNTIHLTYRLALIPERLQGRVNSAFRLVAQGTEPVGLALTGVLLERVGGSSTALVLGAISIGVALLVTLNRHVRHAPALTDGTAA